MKRLTLDLPEPLHRAIKRNAVDEGVTMAEKLRALLAKHYRLEARSPRAPRIARKASGPWSHRPEMYLLLQR